MNFKYEVGMPIVSLDHETDKGVVTRIDEDGAFFRWDDDDPNDEHWCGDWNVIPDTPEAHAAWNELTQKIQSKIDEASSLLEQAFKAWRQANAMQYEGTDNPGDDRGYYEGAYALRSNPGLDLSKFEGVVESNGWSTSSLYC